MIIKGNNIDTVDLPKKKKNHIEIVQLHDELLTFV